MKVTKGVIVLAVLIAVLIQERSGNATTANQTSSPAAQSESVHRDSQDVSPAVADRIRHLFASDKRFYCYQPDYDELNCGTPFASKNWTYGDIPIKPLKISPSGETAYLTFSPDLCGSSGCLVLLLRNIGDDFKIVMAQQGSGPETYHISNHATNGLFDLQRIDYGKHTQMLYFNGVLYSTSKPVPPLNPLQKIQLGMSKAEVADAIRNHARGSLSFGPPDNGPQKGDVPFVCAPTQRFHNEYCSSMPYDREGLGSLFEFSFYRGTLFYFKWSCYRDSALCRSALQTLSTKFGSPRHEAEANLVWHSGQITIGVDDESPNDKSGMRRIQIINYALAPPGTPRR